MEDFRKACGMSGLLRLEIRGVDGTGSRSLALNRPYAIIGSDPSADLHLDDAQVSRRHAYLQAISGRVFCVDLGSRSGIKSEDGRLQGTGWLPAGEDVLVGPYVLRLLDSHGDGESVEAPDELPNPLVDPLPDGGPEIVFNAVDGRSGPISSRLRRRLTLVGGSQDCRIRLRDPSVSRVHCALLSTPEGVWAVDLLGRRGVCVNGRRARSSRFEEGDWLQVGRFVIARPRDGGRREIATIAEAPAPWASPEFQVVANTPQQAAPLPTLAPGGQGWEDSTALLLANQFAMMQRQMFDQFGQMFRTMMELMGDNQREQMALVREEVDRLRQLAGELEEFRSLAPKAAVNPPRAIERQAPPTRPEGPVRPSNNSHAVAPGPAAPPSAEGGGEDALDWVCRRIVEIQGEQQTGWQRLATLMRGTKAGRKPASDSP